MVSSSHLRHARRSAAATGLTLLPMAMGPGLAAPPTVAVIPADQVSEQAILAGPHLRIDHASLPVAESVQGQRLDCAARPEPGLAAAVNATRAQQGLPGLQPLSAPLAERNCRYLTPVLRRILSGGDCDHDLARWQALVEEHGAGSAFGPMSELIACPAPPPLRPAEVVTLWMQSPLHRNLLLHRPRASAIDCLGMTLAGRTAAICTTWRGLGRPQI